MRNFEERKAEIFRRSEKRIKKRRRNRTRMLLCCIPLFICITLSTVMLLPDMLLAHKQVTARMHLMNNNLVCSDILLEVQDMNDEDEYYQQYTDQNVIADILNAIQSIAGVGANDKASHETALSEENSPPEDQETDASSKKSGYKITFTDCDGNKTVYTLVGNTLFAEETQQELTLTEEELSELKSVLGLTEE